MPDTVEAYNFQSDIIHIFVAFAYADNSCSFKKQQMLLKFARAMNRESGCMILIKLFEGVKSSDESESKSESNEYSGNFYSNKKRSSNTENNDRKENKNDYRKSYGHTSASLDEYYEILGISANVTNEEVKKAWRQKALEFHPDKIQNKGLSQAFIDYATEQLQKINNAYDKICKARGI